jgi:hypothetical protein
VGTSNTFTDGTDSAYYTPGTYTAIFDTGTTMIYAPKSKIKLL